MILAFSHYVNNRIIIPILLAYGSDLITWLIQLIFVGRLGDVAIAGTALGTSFCNVTGFSILLGLLSAQDTLISQAYGAKKPKDIGIATYQGAIVLTIVSIFICPIWIVSLTFNYVKLKEITFFKKVFKRNFTFY